ncbi:MAG: kelch repeat-containing protein [Myxococcota bacterium]
MRSSRTSTILALGCGDDEGAAEGDLGLDQGTDMGSDMGLECGPEIVPEGRSEVVAAYDAGRDAIVVFGGNLGGAPTPPSCTPSTVATDEVLRYDLACERWSTLETTGGGPGPLGRMVGALDTARNRLIVFGGRNMGLTNQNATWSLDLETLAWTEHSNPGVRPPARINSTMVHDAGRDRMIVFGGNLGSVLGEIPDQETWVFDLATDTWSELPPGGTPPPARYDRSATVSGDTMYVFGGQVNFIDYPNDVYALDLTTDRWERVRGGGPDAPPTRFGATLVAGEGTLVLAGGHDATALGNLNDLYSLNLGTGEWTQHAAGDAIDGGLDLADPAYAPFGAASIGGEACLRTGRADCTQYCD